jgi:hypothetical protein
MSYLTIDKISISFSINLADVTLFGRNMNLLAEIYPQIALQILNI